MHFDICVFSDEVFCKRDYTVLYKSKSVWRIHDYSFFCFCTEKNYVEITASILFVSTHRIQYEPHTASIPFCTIVSLALTWAHRCKPNLCNRGTRNFFLRRLSWWVATPSNVLEVPLTHQTVWTWTLTLTSWNLGFYDTKNLKNTSWRFEVVHGLKNKWPG